jgi:hypothetical protein
MKRKLCSLLYVALFSCNTRIANQQVNKKKGRTLDRRIFDRQFHYKSIGYYKNDNPIKKWRYYLDGKIIKKKKKTE